MRWLPTTAPRWTAATRRIAGRLLLSLAAVALVAAPGSPEPTRGKARKHEPKQATFKISGGKKITVEHFEPKGNGRFPVIILLHDAAGLAPLPAGLFRAGCHTLAQEGYVALLVHYFDGTGHKEVRKKDATPENFKTWMEAVRGAVAYARDAKKNPKIDGARIGLVGFSLGGYLSLSVAQDKKLKIAAVVEMFGGLPDKLWKDLKYLPPTLIIHGLKDSVISVKEAYALRGLCEACKFSHESKIYEDQDHLFRGKPLWHEDIRDAKLRTLAFFRKHLKNEIVCKCKKVDAVAKMLTLTLFDGTDLVLPVCKDPKVCGSDGGEIKGGIEDKCLIGAELLLRVGPDCKAAEGIRVLTKKKQPEKEKK
jgi:dienelactone hydrolase